MLGMVVKTAFHIAMNLCTKASTLGRHAREREREREREEIEES